jgi:hypothetical protein
MKIDKVPEPDENQEGYPNTYLRELYDYLEILQQKVYEDDISASATSDAGSIADGDEEAKDVTVTGAVLGDYATASLSLDIVDLVLDAQVTAANTVTCVLANNTGGAIDLDSATVYVRVFRRTT